VKRPPVKVAMLSACGIGLAARVQPRHPAPAQRVRRSVAIQQVAIEEIRPSRQGSPSVKIQIEANHIRAWLCR
jgi:hypothetical protein